MPSETAPTVLPPGIRTFKPRRGRVTQRQESGLRDGRPFLIEPSHTRIDLPTTLPGYADVVMEIGFGTGEVTAQMAKDAPLVGILAVDIHTPGIGDLLHRCVHTPLPNVRVLSADALEVLEHMIPADALAGVRTYFPDPWPKARHHKRRLIQRPVIELVADRVRAGGYWHIATDWQEYADSMLEEFAASPHWIGGVIARPEWRPVTRYERAGLREGRSVTDLLFTRAAT